MIPLGAVSVGMRVRFDNKTCAGYGETGTVTKIVKDVDTYTVVWILWDCHGKEVGSCCGDTLNEWIPAEETGLKKWIGGIL